MNWVPFADSLEGGSVVNPFRFTDTSEEAFHSLNSQLQLIMNGEAAPLLADAQVLLKTKITMEWVPSHKKWRPVRKIVGLPSKHKRNCRDHYGPSTRLIIYNRPPFRMAAATRCNQHYWGTPSVAARWLWADPGLSSGRFAVVAPCFCTV